MAKIRITVDAYRCERCSHTWIPRSKVEPAICPKCKSPYWNRKRRSPRTAEGGSDG